MKDVARRLKIAQVITRLDWGGSPDIVRTLCERLDPARFEVTLVHGPSAHMTAKTKAFLSSFHGRVVEVPALVRDVNPGADLAAYRALGALFRREKFEVIHTHTAKAGFLGRLAGRAAGCRAIVHTPHGHNLYGYFNPLLTRVVLAAERFAGRRCEKIIALTALEKKDMVSYSIVPDNKIIVVYQGLELDRYAANPEDRRNMRASLGIPDEATAVGIVGRLEAVKGPDTFIEAAGIIARSHPKAHFIVAGEGAMRTSLERRAAALVPGTQMVFTGWRDDIPEILAALDVFVLPSRNEAVGMALIEAEAAGVAAVASRVGGIPEVVKDGETAVLVTPGDPAALAAAVRALIQDPAKRQAMGEAGAAFVRGRFAAEKMAERIAALYEEELVRESFKAKV